MVSPVLPATLRSAGERTLEIVRALAARALREPVTLTSLPPLGVSAFSYGDLVPLGFALLALNGAAEALRSASLAQEARQVRDYLLAHRTRQLWAYQSGGLETSIDSGLVLLGVRDSEAIEQLERFNVGGGQYVPQLFTDGLEHGKMTVRDSIAHWCQPDYSIACLVKALRAGGGLPRLASLRLLQAGFETRSGLYLANPYFTDWLLALALVGDPEAEPLRLRLRREVLASASDDGSFGQFDTVLSTALAILALNTSDTDPAILIKSRLALADMVESGNGLPAYPFYSTEQISWSRLPPWELIALLMSAGAQQLIRCREQEHAITFYQDTEGMVVFSLVMLALLETASTGETAGRDEEQPSHGRYTCATASDYIAGFALPPYLSLAIDR
jgi:hypothetical protein